MVFSACSSSNKGQQTTGEQPGDWQMLASGSQCNVSEAGQFLVKTDEEFSKLWKDAFEGIDMAPEMPSVNFREHWVVAAFAGMTRSGGHDLQLVSLSKEGEGTLVVFEHLKPGAGCVTASVIEFPFFIASVSPLASEDVRFQVLEKAVACE